MADKSYQTFSYRCKNGGLVARYVPDQHPPFTYRNLQNLESRAENSLSTRLGLYPITSDGATSNFALPGPVQSLGRMQGLGQTFRYASAAGKLYRRVGDGQGQYTQIASGLSSGKQSMCAYRPDANASPYMFIADGNVILKDNGAGSAVPAGIAPPTVPASTTLAHHASTFISSFDVAAESLGSVSGYGTVWRAGLGINPIATAGFQFIPERTPVVPNGGLSRNGAGLTTVTIPTGHSFTPNQKVTIINPLDGTFNANSVPINWISGTQFTYPNAGAAGASGNARTAISGLPSLMPGMMVAIGGFGQPGYYWTEVLQITKTGFYAYAYATNATFLNAICCQGSIAANHLGTVSRAASPPFSFDPVGNLFSPMNSLGSDFDLVSFFVWFDDPYNVTELRIYFDTGNGSFTQDYYYKAVNPATFQPAVSGVSTHASVVARRVFDRAAARADNRRLGFATEDLMPGDLEDLRGLRPREFNTGKATWTQIKIYKNEFVKVGRAGDVGYDWAALNGFSIQIKTSVNAGVTFKLDDLACFGGSGLDAFGLQAYDYRYTYYNINTGAESNPCVASLNTISPHRQLVQVAMTNPTDSQVTHIRVYRRGGTLTQGWYRVDEVPVIANGLTTNYFDNSADSDIVNNPLLQIDNDAPVTTVLANKLSTTIAGVGNIAAGQVAIPVAGVTNMFVGQLVTIGAPHNQETAYIQSINSATKVMTVYCQLSHSPGEPVTATTRPQTPMPLMAIAFDKMWLAGDKNNPNVLYPSKPFRPETFSPAASVEIGTPDAPIMAVVEIRGLLYVLTTKRLYQVLGAGSSVPVVIPTAVKHGLVSNWAWAASEDTIYYESYDGIYAFRGSAATYMTEQTEWVWTGKTLGPLPVQDLNKRAQTMMTYGNHELFVAYTDTGGNVYRQIYHDVYNRWRNDVLFATPTAMLFEEDTGKFIIGGSDGMVYQDRVNDYDSGGWGVAGETKNAIVATLQTPQLDQDVAKAFKQYNELTLDFDSQGQDVHVFLLFDNGTTALDLGKFNRTGRGQTQIKINNGEGQRSLNVGLLLVTAATTAVTFYEVHIRALVEAEFRQSYDSYWLKFGTDEMKVCKQGLFEYLAPDAGGLTFNVFLDGSAAPAFTFTLPQSTTRHVIKKRFPAFKAHTWRFVATSPSDFQLYDESFIEQKPITQGKGYAKERLMANAPN